MALQRSGSDRGAEVQPGGAPPRLKFRRTPDGKLEADEPPSHESVEEAERAPTPDDPRPAAVRDVPPAGGA